MKLIEYLIRVQVGYVSVPTIHENPAVHGCLFGECVFDVPRPHWNCFDYGFNFFHD